MEMSSVQTSLVIYFTPISLKTVDEDLHLLYRTRPLAAEHLYVHMSIMEVFISFCPQSGSGRLRAA